MANVLVVAQQSKGTLKRASRSAVTFAREVAAKSGGKVVGLVLGEGAEAAGAELARYVERVLVADRPELNAYLAGAYVQVVEQAIAEAGADVAVAAATSFGKDLMPRVAAKVAAGIAPDIAGLSDQAPTTPGGLVVRRHVWAGNAIADVEVTTASKIVTVRASEFSPAEPAAGAGEVAKLDGAVDVSALRARYVSLDETRSERPELTEATAVVAGGRGFKSAENLKMLDELADLLGAAIGATRAVVDAGWQPNDLQVGQTGKVIAPDLYVAIGISGAIQHVAGIRGSKVIVAVNKDAEAPIFKVADFGLVGDLFQVLPELTAAIKKAKATA